jgi:hypothetical protein
MSKLLLVINQETITEQVLLRIKNIHPSPSYCFVVSTHYLFPNEISSLKTILGITNLTTKTMSSFLLDDEMEECDDIAYEISLLDSLDVNSFMLYSRTIRNTKVRDKLCKIYNWDYSVVGEGLGLVESVWTDQRTINIKSNNLVLNNSTKRKIKNNVLNTVTSFIKSFLKILFSAFYSYDMLSFGSDRFCLVSGSVNRLYLKDQIRISAINGLLFDTLYKISRITFIKKLITRFTILALVFNTKPAATIHSFTHEIAVKYPDLYVFVDGLHPPNYPKSYGLIYRRVNIVRRSRLDESWFLKNGAYVHSFPDFISEIDFNTVSSRLSQKIESNSPLRVVLMLNHAGDWSALIDRSDTDQCVYEFCKSAATMSSVNYIVRPHPTMTHPQHEGVRSLDRLKAYIDSLNLPNLSFSTRTLDEDIARTDICVSEYSDVLVKCVFLGIACICLNPTGRRSFLEFLSHTGLTTVSTGEQLSEAILALKNGRLEQCNS